MLSFLTRLPKARQSAYTAQRYRPETYKIREQVRPNKALVRGAFSKSQASDKLGAKRFGTFQILELVGKNAVRLDLPINVRIHPVVHVVHTNAFRGQPTDISWPVTLRPDPVRSLTGMLFVVDRILAHRKTWTGLSVVDVNERLTAA